MRQVVTIGTGGAEKLVLQDGPDPTPAGDQLRLRVQACGVNFADILARRGLYPDAPPLPAVVGYEVSGVVDAAGPEADPAWIGREAFALTRFKGYADTVVVPQAQAFAKPASLSHAQAATLPVNYLTAWQLMIVVGALSREDTVLIHNAGGGVGLAAIDIARQVGARSLGTASPSKHAFLTGRGLDAAIDYTAGDWYPEVMRLTAGRGAELILDPLGGAHWKRSLSALRHTGRLAMFGASQATESRLPGPLKLLAIGLGMPWFNPVSLMAANRAVFGVNLGHLWHETDKIRRWMGQILDGVRDGWVRPHVDRSFPLAAAGEAQSYLEQRRNIGKVVLTP